MSEIKLSDCQVISNTNIDKLKLILSTLALQKAITYDVHQMLSIYFKDENEGGWMVMKEMLGSNGNIVDVDVEGEKKTWKINIEELKNEQETEKNK